MRKKRELYPGQVERIDYTMEQAEALASAARSEVFWLFTGEEPRSIAEVAKALGKSPNATTYHVNELVRVGLLIAVDERQKRSRREKLYVGAARSFFNFGADAPAEYRKLAVEGFSAIMRSLVRDRTALNELYDYDTSMNAFSTFGIFSNRLSKERVQELRTRVREILREYAYYDSDPDGVRVTFMHYVGPTLAEVKAALKEAKKGKGEKRTNKPRTKA